jgi:Plavaka transposase
MSLIVQNQFQTAINSFRLWKEYLYRPSYDPDRFISAEDLYQPHISTFVPDYNQQTEESLGPGNKSVDLVQNWQNTGSPMKSNGELNHLVHDVLLHPNFQLMQLQSFDAGCENKKADAAHEKSSLSGGFQHADIKIKIPSGSKLDPPQMFSIPGLQYQQIILLIKETFENPISQQFHFSPFKLFQKDPNSKHSECVYSDVFNLDVFVDEHDKVQQAAETDDPTCKQEKVVAAIMFWSDATCLATFGTAKLWPIYMLFGNLSKYI